MGIQCLIFSPFFAIFLFLSVLKEEGKDPGRDGLSRFFIGDPLQSAGEAGQGFKFWAIQISEMDWRTEKTQVFSSGARLIPL